VASQNSRPIGTSDSQQNHEFSPVVKKSPSLRVLIVDDEPLIRWFLAQTLVESGHAIVEAPDGETAVRALTDGAGSFDVVLLDYRLPDSTDLKLLSTIRYLAPRAAVIMMTAYGTPEVATAAFDLGAYRVVSKPIEVSEVTELVAMAHASISNGPVA
jgi:two-component system, NtrC family, response regulator AtoC